MTTGGAGRRLAAGATAMAVAVSVWVGGEVPAVAAPTPSPLEQHAADVPVKPVGSAQVAEERVARFVPAKVVWPGASETTIELDTAGRGRLQRVGLGPVSVGVPETARVAPKSARVRVLDRAASEALIGPGVVAAVTATPGSQAVVSLDYADFAAAAGADYAGRLQLVALPACALTSPEVEECREYTDLGSVNDLKSRTLTATITLPQPAPAPEPVQPTAAPVQEPPTEPGTGQPTSTLTPEPAAPADPSPTPSSIDPTPSPVDPTPTPTTSETPATTTPEPTAPPASTVPTDDDPNQAPTPADTTPAAPVDTRAAESVVVIAAVAATSSDQGDFRVSSLRPSAIWDAGESTGEFTWQYPLRMPSAPGGLAPSLAISYSSGGTDGGVSNTNNQASWVGEGFELANAFIERRYANCYDDRSGGSNSSSSAQDLCWFTDDTKTNNQKWDNAFLTMDGHAGELVRIGNSAEWRLERDDGTRVQKLGSVGSGTEYWRVTTPDGVQYFFGRGRPEGAAAPDTNSVWKVPIAGNHTGEPGYKDGVFADAFNSRPWRWNLDYVVAPTGATMTYLYAVETNKYKRNLSTSVSYDRGGVLRQIQWGERRGAETDNDAPAKVWFTVEERCDTSISASCKTVAPTSSTAKAWPDVPMDAVCDASYCPSQKTSPTFFTRKRLMRVDAYTRNAAGTGWETGGDRWELGGSFPKPTDGAAVPSLWLASIRHSGRDGGALPPVTLGPAMLPSRITGSTVALEKPRLRQVSSESGGKIVVNYSLPECTVSNLPTEAEIPNNTRRCMPVPYQAGTGAVSRHWFNKYVVTDVFERDTTPLGGDVSGLGLDIAADVVTHYSYSGGAAWRYTDSPLVPKKYRTWSQWRGYSKVTATVGTGPTKQITENLYFRGMNGDRATAAGGTKSVHLVDSEGISLVDRTWLAGTLRESRALDGSAEDSGTITDPRDLPPVTADDGRTEARQVGTAATRTRQRLAAGGRRQGRTTTLAWDGRGHPTLVENAGDLAVSGDDTCTTTSYAVPTDAAGGVIDRVASTSTMPAPCDSQPDPDDQVIAASRHYYGTDPLGVVSGAALQTRTDRLTGSGSSRTWKTTARAGYDTWGRPTSTTDALGNVTATSYTHTTGGQPTTIRITSADPDATGPATPLLTTTTLDNRWGAPIKQVQPGGQTTEATLDEFGRVTAVWQPGRPRAQTASVTYAYTISATTPSSVTTRTLLPNGTSYATSVTLLDSRLRTRQVQNPSPAYDGGRLVTDTRYDSRGNPVLVDAYYNSSPPAAALVAPSSRTEVRASHRYRYDFANRPTWDGFHSREDPQWETITSYDGDRVRVTPPAGGTPTTTVSDLQGRTTALIQHLGSDTTAPGATTSYSYDPAGNLAGMTDAKANSWTYSYDLAGNRITSNDPDKGTTTMAYDLAGNLIAATDARGITIRHRYDHLGRATATTKGDGTTLLTSTTWDSVMKGLVAENRRHLTDAVITTRVNSYDTAGRATATTLEVPEISGLVPAELAGQYTTTTTYNPDGTIATQTLPAAGGLTQETLTTGYTAAGRPSSLTGTAPAGSHTYVASTNYYEWGPILGTYYGPVAGNNTFTLYDWDEPTLRLDGWQLTRGYAGIADTTQLTWDPAGNLTSMTSTLADEVVDTQCFAYDPLGQLTEAWTPTENCDPGNRSADTLTGPAPYWTSWATDVVGKTTSRTDRTPTTATTTDYTYNPDGSTQPHFVTGTTSTGDVTTANTYTADQTGNTITRPGPDGTEQTLVWDDTNQLTRVLAGGQPVADMVYDTTGTRLIRRQNDTTTLYLGGTEITASTGTAARAPLQPDTAASGDPVTAVRYYSHAGQPVAARTSNSDTTLTLLITDHQGTIRHQISNDDGQLHTTWQDPYGAPRGNPPTSWVGEKGFVGGTRDATGLTRTGARDYDAALQRFITIDPVQDLADPLQWNPYLYANNTPPTKSDPTGLRPATDSIEDAYYNSHPEEREPRNRPPKPETPEPSRPGDRVRRRYEQGFQVAILAAGYTADAAQSWWDSMTRAYRRVIWPDNYKIAGEAIGSFGRRMAGIGAAMTAWDRWNLLGERTDNIATRLMLTAADTGLIVGSSSIGAVVGAGRGAALAGTGRPVVFATVGAVLGGIAGSVVGDLAATQIANANDDYWLDR